MWLAPVRRPTETNGKRNSRRSSTNRGVVAAGLGIMETKGTRTASTTTRLVMLVVLMLIRRCRRQRRRRSNRCKWQRSGWKWSGSRLLCLRVAPEQPQKLSPAVGRCQRRRACGRSIFLQYSPTATRHRSGWSVPSYCELRPLPLLTVLYHHLRQQNAGEGKLINVECG